MSFVSIVEYMHDLKEAGFTDKQSEVQARRLELMVANVQDELKKDLRQELYLEDLVKKQDLALAVERVRADLEAALASTRSELQLSIETTRSELQLSIETTRKDLELALGNTRSELQLSIEKTRRDLEIAIEKMRYETLKFIVWTGVAVVVTLTGMLAKGFHWL